MPSGTTLTPHQTPGRSHSAGAAPASDKIIRPHDRRIVVGVDSSSDTVAAIEWAATEAAARGVGLHIVHTWTWQMMEPWSHTVDRMVIADLKTESRTIVKKCVDLAQTHAGLTITAETIQGYAPDVLSEQGKQAGLIVVGSHHLHALGRAVLGSVSSALVARASCPVVVVAAPPGLKEEAPEVVVGVAGTEEDGAVLEFAFAHASRHGRALRALYLWNPPFGDAKLPPPARAQVWLAESLAGWQEQFPDVQVHAAVVRDHPVDGLVAASASQDLLVVGRHSRRMHLGTLLGSVSLGVLHHASCPVAVIPPAEHAHRTQPQGGTP